MFELPSRERVPVYLAHPDCLAVAARLAGLSPAPVERCRVLEIGCGAGGHLIPLAEAFPDSRFVGLDEPGLIAEARQLTEELGLTNLTFGDAPDGLFDYIVCDEVYSLAARDEQVRLLATCRAHLAPDGVAAIGYSVLPGWERWNVLRGLVRFHARTRPAEGEEGVRALLAALPSLLPDPDAPYGAMVRDLAARLATPAEADRMVQLMAPQHEALGVAEFVARAATAGLQFLGESGVQPSARDLPAGAQQAIGELAQDRIDFEHYIDFYRNTELRRTLLCQTDRQPAPPTVAALEGLRASARAWPPATLEVSENEPISFRNELGFEVDVDELLAQTILLGLVSSYPAMLTLSELSEMAAAAGLSATPAQVAETVLTLYRDNLLHLHAGLPPFVAVAGPRPRASAWAQLQAAMGPRVTNRRHYPLQLDELDRLVLYHCDGSRDRDGLLDALIAAAHEGLFSVTEEGHAVDASLWRERLAAPLERSLQDLARAALLVE